MTNVEPVLLEAMKLSGEERSELADRLARASGSERSLELAWPDEADRRFADLDAGRLTATPWEDARARIFAK